MQLPDDKGELMKIQDLTACAVLTAVALVIFLVEAQIPPVIAVPGIKLGLANVVTLFALVFLGKKQAFVILLARVFLGNLFAGQMMSFFYSLSGGICCFVVMALLLPCLSSKQLWVCSVFGAVAHNIGQLMVAAGILQSWHVFWYLPILGISAVITGTFTGLCVQFLGKYFRRWRLRRP